MIIAGTGHRPKYCPCKYNESHPWLAELKNKLRLALDEVRPVAIISGMAIGWDTWLAEVSLSSNIPLHCYVPFKGQGKTWPSASYKKYLDILDRAALVKHTSENYTPDCFFVRDKAMIDDCSIVFSLLDPSINSGGTYYTVQYAKEKNKPITNFWF
jgi:uncharacterized phage-like protein YoqJ